MRGAIWAHLSVALALVAACGGSAFEAGPADAGAGDGAPGADTGTGNGADAAGAADAPPTIDGATVDALSGEAGLAEASTGPAVHCGPISCSGTTPVCCVGMPFSCAHMQCGCQPQLDCASNADCAGGAVCCINDVNDVACPSGHPLARCATSCQNGAQQLCNPQAPACANAQCSTNSGDLQNAGLPPGAGYGVCK